MTNELEGNVAFITGAARGMGRAEAVHLARAGADIIGIDNCRDAATTEYPGPTVAELEETGRLVEAEGRRAVMSVADVRDADGLTQALHDGVDQLGGLDIVVANAGICSAAKLWEVTDEQWDETIAVNLTGVFHTLRAVTPIMIDQGRGGSIIVTSSVAGVMGLPFLSHYGASKHGVVGLVRALANEVAEYEIRVNSIHPTGVATGIQSPALMRLVEEKGDTLGPIFMNALPSPEILDPDDVVGTVLWLASDAGRYTTGAQIPIDKGKLNR